MKYISFSETKETGRERLLGVNLIATTDWCGQRLRWRAAEPDSKGINIRWHQKFSPKQQIAKQGNNILSF